MILQLNKYKISKWVLALIYKLAYNKKRMNNLMNNNNKNAILIIKILLRMSKICIMIKIKWILNHKELEVVEKGFVVKMILIKIRMKKKREKWIQKLLQQVQLEIVSIKFH